MFRHCNAICNRRLQQPTASGRLKLTQYQGVRQRSTRCRTATPANQVLQQPRNGFHALFRHTSVPSPTLSDSVTREAGRTGARVRHPYR